MSELRRETDCLIGLGGNVGPVRQTIQSALEQLAGAGCQIIQTSRFYNSAPMGPNSGQGFINAATRLETALPPHELLNLLQQIEDDSGRTRTVRWGPRTLDMDLLCYGQQVLSSDCLIIPHPGIWYRRFVLEPLVEIAPDWHHASLEMSVGELRERLDRRPLKIEIESAELPRCPERFRRQLQLQTLFPETALTPVARDVFCRFVTESSRQPGGLHSGKFTLEVDAGKLDSMLASVADAALGTCEA